MQWTIKQNIQQGRMVRKYFEAEMRYLLEEGKVYARRHPEQARMLNIDSLRDRDPYVERLFEGFAFLAGRIHERLDDELPEYTDGFFSLLYPHFLRPVPALSIVEMKPGRGQVTEPTTLEKGTEVRSRRSENVTCRFVTTEDITVRPLQLEQVGFNLEKDNTHSVACRFRVNSGARMEADALKSVRLQFNAEALIASTMHLFFTRHVERVVVQKGSGEEATSVTLNGQEWVKAAGFDSGQGVLPYSERTFSGSRLLLEYFVFRSRFWSVDLLGLDRLGALEGDDTFTVTLKFDREYPEDRRFSAANVLLHCCPIINLFESDADPVRVDHTDYEYRIAPDSGRDDAIEIHDVTRVVGVEEKTGKRREYRPYYSFDGRDDGSGGDASRYFIQRFRRGPDERRATYLSMKYSDRARSEFEPEVLSIDIRATNGNRPRELLREDTITELGPDVPGIVEPSNISAPTRIRHAPTDSVRDYFWKLLSHLSLNRTSVASRESLTEIFRLYDWSGSDANKRRIDGIRSVTWTGTDRTMRGSVLRGGLVTVEVEENHFSDEGDICLFGRVLSEFFSMYATINSFVHLKIVAKPSEQTYMWTPDRGKKAQL